MTGARADVQKAIAHLQALAPGPADDSTEKVVAAMRRCMDSFGDIGVRRMPRAVRVEPVLADGVAAEWLVPEHRLQRAAIVHFHGGGLAAGSLRSHRIMLAHLAVLSQRAVLSVDYRLAPEHAFPAAHEDCARAYAWAIRNGPDGEEACDHLTLGGDSIGAALAIATYVSAKHIRRPNAMVLLCPTLTGYAIAKRPERASDVLLNNAAFGSIALYAGSTPTADPRISPANFDDDAFADFPPTLIQVGAPEFLLPDSVGFAARLTRLNRRAVLSVWPDMFHTWHHFTDHLPESRAALQEIAQFLVSIERERPSSSR